MNIAFVGITRKYQELDPNYIDLFNQTHLEIPYYYSKYGENNVVIVTEDYSSDPLLFDGDNEATLQCIEKNHLNRSDWDIVIHWRKWNEEFYDKCPKALHVINSQDHSYGVDFLHNIKRAFSEGKLFGFLAFEGWHAENLFQELRGFIPKEKIITNLTLGVDTDLYKPAENKNPFEMLWASDPGRGLQNAIRLAVELFQHDHRFRLNVIYPDYVKDEVARQYWIRHPAIIWRGQLKNGPELWNLFNTCGVLPYTSTFFEPSSRAVRQSQAAGSLILYPPNMGTPSGYVKNDHDGIVAPVSTWLSQIMRHVVNDGTWKKIGNNARQTALAENWEVQAKRFNKTFEGLI